MRPSILVHSFSATDMAPVSFVASLAPLLHELRDWRVSYGHITRHPIAVARNLAAARAMQEEVDFLAMIDDDMTFKPDSIRKLESHGVGVACALAYSRHAPYESRIWSFLPGDRTQGLVWEGAEHTGLRAMDISGFAFSLIRTSVLVDLRNNGVETFFADNPGKGPSEDFYFSRILKENNVPLFVDTDLIVGHMGAPVIVDEDYKQRHLKSPPPHTTQA